MWRFLKKLLLFRMAQKTTRGAARVLGFRKYGLLLGLIGGWRALRQHRQHRHA
jgi:hypothetical protein